MDGTGEIQVVCFDLGGVLVRICRSWEEACDAAGIDAQARPWPSAGEPLRGALLHRYSVGRISEQEWADRTAEASQGAYSASECLRVHDAVCLGEYAEVGAIVDDLSRAGVRTACLSNTTHTHWAALMDQDGKRAPAGTPRFPTVMRLGTHFASHILGLAKPDPAIYRAFETNTGFAASQILFFDDLLENVAGARNAGWASEGIDYAHETAPQIRRALDAHGVFRGRP